MATDDPTENNLTEVTVSELPLCDFCETKPAEYDSKIIVSGQWAYMCQAHFDLFGIGLGTGKGQRLVVRGQ